MNKFLWTLSDIRRKTKLTQEEIGQKLGVKGRTVGTWERGEYTPQLTPEQTLTLCNTLGITLEELNEAIKNTQKEKET